MAEQTRFTLKVGEIYRNLEAGVDRIAEGLAAADAARLSNLPDDLMIRLLEARKGKGKKTEVFWRDEEQEKTVRGAGVTMTLHPESAVLTSRWYQEFIGEKLQMGEVLADEALWHLLWRPETGEVRRILENSDKKCNPCIWKKNFMMRFEGEHLYATVYDRVEGLRILAEHAAEAEVFRAVVIPPFLLKDVIVPAKQKKDYKFILSRRDPLARFFADDEGARYGSSAKIYYVYGEQEATVGSLRLDADYYSIFWRGNEVFNVMKFNNRICSNCLSRVFDTAWKYSEKV